MHRATGMIAALIGVLAVIPGAFALPANRDASARPLALVRVAECSRGPAAIDRQATFRATMRRVAGAERMAMRFSLQERVGDGRFRTVKARGLAAWRKSYQGVRRFSHRQRVLALAEGSDYRVVVSFRWYAGDGQLIRRTRRRSKPCAQPGALPNLSVLRIGGRPLLLGIPGSHAYTVEVANRGSAAAPRFRVSLAADGGIVDTQSVPALARGEVRRLSFAGPACERSLTARVDPEDAVRESSEKDNFLVARCPPGE